MTEEPDAQTVVPLKIEDGLTVIVMGLLSLITSFVKVTRPVYDKWKNTVGVALVKEAEDAIAACKK